ncbi:MAG TPA: YlcI/YnfO family protein [Actinomycetota bacterium]|nr:YlcI/YnfO family protein [Actinomycetota bacterium]
MDLRPYVENIHQQLAVAAAAGDEEAQTLAERLAAPLDAAVRLTLQDVLALAAEEITLELAPGSVELRLRGSGPEFVVTLPPSIPADTQEAEDGDEPDPAPAAYADSEDGAVSRINLRLPDQLKARIEEAAAREGLSVNAWLVRAAGSAIDRTEHARRRERHVPRGPQRYTGWVR